MDISLDEIRRLAETQLEGAADGGGLEPLEIALIRFGLAASVTSLAEDAIARAIAEARDAGATSTQLQEVASLVSGLGTHTLMATSRLVARADAIEERPLTPAEQALWDRHVGDDPFWTDFERALPGFLGAMLRLSPDQFTAFFDYCAVPWKSGAVRARLKELIAMACDATPEHRFLPGFRLHLANAIKLGASRTAIVETLDMAAQAPPHRGVG